MIVDFVLKTGISRDICAGLSLQHDRAPVPYQSRSLPNLASRPVGVSITASHLRRHSPGRCTLCVSIQAVHSCRHTGEIHQHPDSRSDDRQRGDTGRPD